VSALAFLLLAAILLTLWLVKMLKDEDDLL